MGADKLVLGPWPRGMVQAGDRALVPDEGLWELRNGLLGDDALPFKRGGSVLKSNADFSANGLRWIWDGYLAGGPRTLLADSSNLGQLAADDVTPTTIVAAGVAAPVRAAAHHGLLVIEGMARAFGGSRKGSDYSTGTISAIAGSSRTVTGTGTSWLANVDAGMILTIGGAVYGVVESVGTNTSLTLAEPPNAADAAGLILPVAYSLVRYVTALSAPAIVGSVAGRLLFSNHAGFGTDQVAFTSRVRPFQLSAAPDDYHGIPGGSQTLGIEAFRDTASIFTTSGVWAISGLQNELVDPQGNPQQRLEQVNRDVILWHRSGIANWRGALIVPAQDGVWLMDSLSAPTRISANITDLYRFYVGFGGLRPGGAWVHKNHYFLPIIGTTDGTFVDLLVCRLTETREGPPFAWSRFNGAGANMTAAVERAATATAAPVVLGAGRQSSSRVLALPYFSPAAANKNDHDGTTHLFEIGTGNIGTGNMVRNFIKRLRLRYQLLTTDAATLEASVATDSSQVFVVWQVLVGLLSSNAPGADPGRFVWPVKKGARYVALRLRSVGPSSSLILRSIELFVRKSGRYR